MTKGANAAKTDIGEYLAERVSEIEKQSETAGSSLRETAKWIISGIAVATAGVIAGTSLSSLGALGFGATYFEAIAAAAIGYAGLGILFATALAVIVPRDHTLQEIADGTEISSGWQREIAQKLQPLLPGPFKTLKEFCAYAEDPRNDDKTPLSGEDLVTFNMSRRWIGAKAQSVERELQFRRLKRRTFAITPVIALAFIAFSSLANPSAEKRVPVLEKTVDVDQNDIAVLRAALASPTCAAQRLPVIVLSEWPSGAQDVVTVPASGCPPVRLRLDHGRFSKAQQ
jgi:hypothetical protein